MNAVILDQLGLGVNRIQEERDQLCAVLPGQFGIKRVEVSLKFAKVRRRAHSHQKHRDFPLLQFGQHRIDILAGLFGLDPAQQVVSAQLQNEQVRLFGLRVEREGKPLKTRRRRITRNPGIADPRIHAAGPQGRLQFCRIAVFRRNIIAGKQAVTECQNAHLRPHHGHLCCTAARRGVFSRSGRRGLCTARSQQSDGKNGGNYRPTTE